MSAIAPITVIAVFIIHKRRAMVMRVRRILKALKNYEYAQLTLAASTGTFQAMIWNEPEHGKHDIDDVTGQGIPD